MSSDINNKLTQFLTECQIWEKKPTNIQGVFLLKLPATKQSASSIAIEINHATSTAAGSTSTFTRKKGIIIRDGSELERFNQLLSNPKVIELAKKIEAVNPNNKEDAAKSDSSTSKDVFDI